MLLFVSNPIPPSLTASFYLTQLLLTSLSSFHYPLPCLFPPPLLLSPKPLTLSPSPHSICLLFSISFFFALSLSSILCSFFTALLSACSLLPLLFFPATSHPLFSLCLFLSPFLLLQPFSPSLWVSGLCGGSQASVGHLVGKELKSKLCNHRGRTEEGKTRNNRKERKKCRNDGRNSLYAGDRQNVDMFVGSPTSAFWRIVLLKMMILITAII